MKFSVRLFSTSVYVMLRILIKTYTFRVRIYSAAELGADDRIGLFYLYNTAVAPRRVPSYVKFIRELE